MKDMTTGALLYYGGLTVWSAFLAYTLLFTFFKPKAKEVAPSATFEPPRPIPSAYNQKAEQETKEKNAFAVEGFKAFQTGEELTVDDIVKGLTR